jgi:hypothetical protein
MGITASHALQRIFLGVAAVATWYFFRQPGQQTTMSDMLTPVSKSGIVPPFLQTW